MITYHGFTPLHVANGGDSLQIWRVADNRSNKQSRTAACGVVIRLGGWATG
jgi:hypothetical protein